MANTMDVQVNNIYRLIGTMKVDGVAENIAAATVKKIRIKSPDGTVSDVASGVNFVTDGTDGKLYYDHNPTQEGFYEFQFYLEYGTFKGYTNARRVRCRANL